MSTTFDVFPTRDVIPTFQQLLDVATGHLQAFLRSYQIPDDVHLEVLLQKEIRWNLTGKSRTVPLDLHAPVWWPEDHYAFFMVAGTPEGTTAYCERFACYPNDPYSLLDEVEEVARSHGRTLVEPIECCKKIDRWWYFHRSAGQPAINSLAYGILAASLAELTGGFLYSGDSAWGWKRLPAWPADFLRVYLRPELADDPDDREWALYCIEEIRTEWKKWRDGVSGT